MQIDKNEIENAIQEINNVVMDFTEAAESLRDVKELLLKLLEHKEQE